MTANRRQISLKQILFATALLSVIFTLAGPGKLPLSETLVMVASFGVAIGLWQQSRDINAAITAGDAADDLDVLRTWRFERMWRLLLASFVLIGWVTAALISQGVFRSAIREDSEFRNLLWSYADGLVLLVVVAGIASSFVRWRVAPRTLFTTWVHRAGWIAGTALLVLVTIGETALIDALVHIAIRSIEMAQPEPYGETFYAGGVRRYLSCVTRFAWVQTALVASVMVNVTMLVRATVRRPSRWACAGYIFSIMVAMGFALWNRLSGFASIAPILADTPSPWIASVWRPAIPLIVLFGFAATYRLLGHEVFPVGGRRNWRPTGKVYLSESWWLIAVAGLGSVWSSLADLYYYPTLSGPALRKVIDALNILSSPPHYLHLALAAACVQLAAVRILRKPLAGEVHVDLQLNRFAYTWIAVTMTTYVTLEAAFGASFVYWIVAWKPLPLF